MGKKLGGNKVIVQTADQGNTVRSVIPRHIAILMKVKPGDVVEWTAVLVHGEEVVTVKKLEEGGLGAAV